MQASHLTYLIREVIATIDTGRYRDISIGEVEEHIRAGDLISFLERRIGNDLDLSLFRPSDAYDDSPFARAPGEIVTEFQKILGACDGGQRKMSGVVNSGLCLVVAWAVELLQAWHRNQGLAERDIPPL